MVPTWKDVIVQTEINRTRTLRSERNHILKTQLEPNKRILDHWLVRFGTWLERTGCRLQTRYARPQSLDINVVGAPDVRYQNC